MRKDKSLIELEKKAKIKSAMEDLENFIKEAEKKKESLMQNAKTAKLKNDKTNYKLALMGLANTISAKNKVEQMLLSMDIVMTMRDVSKMTSGFLGCMSSLCKEVSVLSKDNSFASVSKGFAAAMRDFNINSQGLETLMDEATVNFEVMDLELDKSIMQEIEAMVDMEDFSGEEELDKSIEQKLERLKKSNNI